MSDTKNDTKDGPKKTDVVLTETESALIIALAVTVTENCVFLGRVRNRVTGREQLGFFARSRDEDGGKVSAYPVAWVSTIEDTQAVFDVIQGLAPAPDLAEKARAIVDAAAAESMNTVCVKNVCAMGTATDAKASEQ